MVSPLIKISNFKFQISNSDLQPTRRQPSTSVKIGRPQYCG